MEHSPTRILCIGSVLWDIIGRSVASMRVGSDVPGRITRIPGGVTMNIAMTLKRFGLDPVLLSAIGQDAEGQELVAQCQQMGIETAFTYRSPDLPTDRYMAVEGAEGVIAAIADAHSLETAGSKILSPLFDGRLGRESDPWSGAIALDGNLTLSLIEEIAQSPLFAMADLRVAPASPGKAERLIPLLGHPRATIYVNREEAGLICQHPFDDAERAALGLLARGATRVLVTDGSGPACDAALGHAPRTAVPPSVDVTRVTGAGDTFMAAHIAAELSGAQPPEALERALFAAASYVSGDISQ